ncbi:MAG: hypothetical protein SGJ18_02830 [Pseudomonadota bacterium]|nr:hypothetical protein [Pseudomonadota bacterium]
MKIILAFCFLGILASAADAEELSGKVRLLTCDRWTYFNETRSWSCTATPREVFVGEASNVEVLRIEIESLKARVANLENQLKNGATREK